MPTLVYALFATETLVLAGFHKMKTVAVVSRRRAQKANMDRLIIRGLLLRFIVGQMAHNCALCVNNLPRVDMFFCNLFERGATTPHEAR